jgi:hypothetical protein
MRLPFHNHTRRSRALTRRQPRVCTHAVVVEWKLHELGVLATALAGDPAAELAHFRMRRNFVQRQQTEDDEDEEDWDAL